VTAHSFYSFLLYMELNYRFIYLLLYLQFNKHIKMSLIVKVSVQL